VGHAQQFADGAADLGLFRRGVGIEAEGVTKTNSGTCVLPASRPLCERSLFMPWSAVTST
jgi:hypothetical protein